MAQKTARFRAPKTRWQASFTASSPTDRVLAQVRKGGRAGMTMQRLEVALDMSTLAIERALEKLAKDAEITVVPPSIPYNYHRYFVVGKEPKPLNMPAPSLALPIDARSQPGFNGRPTKKKGEEYQKLKAALQARVDGGLPFTPEDVARDAGFYAPTLYVRKELHAEVKQASRESML